MKVAYWADHWVVLTAVQMVEKMAVCLASMLVAYLVEMPADESVDCWVDYLDRKRVGCLVPKMVAWMVAVRVAYSAELKVERTGEM